MTTLSFRISDISRCTEQYYSNESIKFRNIFWWFRSVYISTHYYCTLKCCRKRIIHNSNIFVNVNFKCTLFKVPKKLVVWQQYSKCFRFCIIKLSNISCCWCEFQVFLYKTFGNFMSKKFCFEKLSNWQKFVFE